MEQLYKENKKYEILTSTGWENFDGIIKNENSYKDAKLIVFNDETFIKATNKHSFFISGVKIAVEDLKIGDILDSEESKNDRKIINIEDIILQDTYDIFNTESHTFSVNRLKSKNCDEFAFVKPSIAENFYGALYPTISAQADGRFIITSTINGVNQFSKIFVAALNHENRFHAHQVDWWEKPGRDEQWKQDQIKDLGSVEKFEQEYGNKIYNDAESIIDAHTSNLLKRVKKVYSKNTDDYLESLVTDTWLADLKILHGHDFSDKSKHYAISIDFADGYGMDYTVAQVFEVVLNSRAQIINPEYHASQSSDMFGLKQVAIWRDNRTDIDDFSKGMSKFLFNYLKPENTVLVVEANDFRWNILDNILKMNPKFKDYIYLKTKHSKDAKHMKIGVRLNTANKKYYFNLMKRYINNKRIKIFEEDTVTEFLSFGIDKTGGWVSQTGHDDAVMSVLNSVAFLDSGLFSEFCDDIIQERYKHTFKSFQTLLSKKNKNDSMTSLYKVAAAK